MFNFGFVLRSFGPGHINMPAAMILTTGGANYRETTWLVTRGRMVCDKMYRNLDS